MHHLQGRTPILIALILILAPAALAAFPVNLSAAGDQVLPAVAAAADGDFVVVWQTTDTPSTPANTNIEARRFSADGSPVGGEITVSDNTAFGSRPRVATAPDGAFVVVWPSYQSFLEPNSFDIFARRYNASGVALGPGFRVNSFTTGRQTAPDVAMADDGSFVVIWQSEGSPGSDEGVSAILGRRFTPNGSPVGTDFQVNAFGVGPQISPAVDMRSDGSFVAVWSSLGSPGSDNSGFSVLGRRFSAAGSPIGGDFQANGFTAGSQREPDVALAPDGSFSVVWSSTVSPQTDNFLRSIVGRSFNSDGSVASSDFQINSAEEADENAPSVRWSSSGEMLVTWSSRVDLAEPDADDVRGRLFAASGSASGPDFRINPDASGIQSSVAITGQPSGEFVAVWADSEFGGGPDGVDVQGRRLPGGCIETETRLCVNQDRFAIQIDWERPNGEAGSGRTSEITDDTGYFWFFNPDNVEVIVKVLDACGFNQRYWVFAAGLTNVEVDIAVTDTVNGTTVNYTNPQGTPFEPIQDTQAFATCGANDAAPVPAAAAPPGDPAAPLGGLLLNDSRFEIEVDWETPQGMSGQGVPVMLTDDTGYFTFFNPDNVEVVIKVLNACGFNQRYWVFAAGLTNVEVEIRVTDTQTGATRTYTNPQGRAFPPLQDTGAFATCP